MALPDDLARHARKRWRLLVAATLALATVGGVRASLPVCDEDTVRAALAGASGVDVAPGDFVWLASSGRIDDLVHGRRVAFLGAAPGSPRDVYWGRAKVTPTGRLLSVGPITRVTWTAEADERDLAADSDHFAWASFVDNHYNGVAVASASLAAAPRAMALPEPSTTLRYELQGARVVASFGNSRGFAVDLQSGELVGGEVIVMVERPLSSRAIEPAVALSAAPAGAPAALPEQVVLTPGGEPAVRHGRVGDADVLRLDPRQLDFVLVPGREAEWPNGGTPHARVPEAWRAAKPVAIVSFDVAGGVVGPAALGALTEGTIAMGTDTEGALFLGPYSSERGRSIASSVQWSSRASKGGHVVCVDADGGLVVAWSEAAAPAAEGLGCVNGWVVAGSLRSARWGEGLDLIEPFAATSLIAFRHPWGPTVAAPSGSEWRAAADSLPRPAFIPAVHKASTKLFESEVEVTRFDLARFDLRVIAGAEEKAHRLGGEFQRAIPEAEHARALFSISLGVGKRKHPRGLKVAGSLGHKFSRKEGILAVGAGTARVGEGGAYDAEAEPLDATELPQSIARGQLARAARERGPVQRRADMCVIGGELLVAEAEFDSHEATAETLLRLGCENAVALDRGSEPPVRLERGTPPVSASETRLIGLERPLSRRVSTNWSSSGEP